MKDAYAPVKRHSQIHSRLTTNSAPLTQQEWVLVLSQKIDIRNMFAEHRIFNSVFTEKGIQDDMRGALWCNLLRVKVLKDLHSPQLFAKLSALPNKELENIIEKDTIVDRSCICIDKDTDEYLMPDRQKFRAIITAYGNIDMELGYNQGYNFLITLMLHYIDDEEDVFWALHRIMFDLDWRGFYLDGMAKAV